MQDGSYPKSLYIPGILLSTISFLTLCNLNSFSTARNYFFCWEGGSYKKLAPFGRNAYQSWWSHLTTAPTCRETSWFVRLRPKAKGAGTKTTSNPRRRYRAERDGTNIRKQDHRTKLDFPRADFYLIYFGSYSSSSMVGRETIKT